VYRYSSGMYWYTSTTGVQELCTDTVVVQGYRGTGVVLVYRSRTGLHRSPGVVQTFRGTGVVQGCRGTIVLQGYRSITGEQE
jgi:hypothetical protein